LIVAHRLSVPPDFLYGQCFLAPMVNVSAVSPGRLGVLLVLMLAAIAPRACAQAAPEGGGHEVQLWTGGGYTVPGGTKDTGIWNLGLRYGWILTDAHGPSVLKGRFEYAVDAVPLFLVFQPANTAYGVALDPVTLKWNFASHGRFSPFMELNGGVLFTNHNVPTVANTVNFTSSLALGTHILQEKYNWSMEVRYMHISDAGLTVPNPGINTVQVRLGIGRFFPPRPKK
jgi:Lipid A 3-O-deacylase (PagL)